MADDHEVDWGNDEDDFAPSKSLFGSIRMSHETGDEPDDVEDAVSLGGDEEEDFAAYSARPNEQNTPPTDKPQTIPPKTDVRRRSASVGISPKKKAARQARPAPLPPSPQPENRQPTPKLTHALPPKPVVFSSFRVPSSTTAASPMSLPRKERRSNGNATNASDEPPSDRETKNPRIVVREDRHRESHPDESSWTRPGSSTADLSSLPQDRTKSIDDKESRSSSRRDDDLYRPSHRQARYSSDEEGKESSSHLAQSRNDMRYHLDDRDKRHNYASSDHNDRPTTRTARLSPEGDSLDRVRPGYREPNDSDTRRVHIRDRDVSPVRDDSSRRVPRRVDYHDYDSFDKGSREFDDPSRRATGTAERSRYPEAVNGRANSVSSREPYAQNQGPGRSPTLRRNPPSPRPRSRTPPYNRRDDRGHTPPRYQEYPADSRIPHDRGRAESPPSRSRGSERLDQHDGLLDLPQRRPRPVSDTRDPDYSVKRRRTEDRDGNPSSVRRGPVGPDTYTPQEPSTASTSPRSTGALDDFSRPRRREPLPSQSLRYKEASSDQNHRRPVSGSNRVMPQPQPTAPSHRHYPHVPREQDVLQSRHQDIDISRTDRPRSSGHDLVHPYPDKLRRDDHMDVDPPYSSRVSQYEEPARLRDLGSRPSSHTDAMIREAIPPTARPRRRDSFNARPTSPVGSASMITEKIRGRSRDRSPRSYQEPRQTNVLPSSAPLSTMPPGLPRDTHFVEDYRQQEKRRVDRDREGHSPTLPRNSSNAVASRLQPSGRYDEPGGQRPPRSPELRPTPSNQEQPRHRVSRSPSTRRERPAPPISGPNETPLRVRGDSTSKRDSPQERPSRPGPAPDTNFPPPPLPSHTSREWTPRQPVQPEFMLSLPPPSTRLPGAPPPPLLPSHLCGPPRDHSVHPHSLPPKDESGSAKVESELDRRSPQQGRFRPRATSPVRQTKESLRAQQAQEGRQEPTQVQPLDNSLRLPVDDVHKENSRYGRHILTPVEDRRPIVPSDDRQTKPASWDRPRNSHPKPIALPASLPPKPVAALGDLPSIQPSTSLRTGNQSRGRRAQQPSDESSGHNARWGSAPRRDGGGDINDRERNRWGEYRAPPLLARMSSGDSLGQEVLEIRERGGGETQKKRARAKKYQGV